MKFQDIITFKKNLPQSLILVISKDEGERREIVADVLKTLPAETVRFDSETFTREKFTQEVETLSFFSKKRGVFLHGIDELGPEDIKTITAYACRLNPAVILLLSAGQLAASTKLYQAFDANGAILHLPEEKPWQKEKVCEEWLKAEAASRGVTLSVTSAQRLVKSLGIDRTLLRMELEKLLTFAFGRREITTNDIEAISCPMPTQTIWQLGEAIFALDARAAIAVGRELLREGTAIYALIANLRTQIQTALQIYAHYHIGGAASVTKAFPYLKGGLLDKKIQGITHYGEKRLKEALIHLYEAEIQSKNQTIDPELLLELLLTKLTRSRDAAFTTA